MPVPAVLGKMVCLVGRWLLARLRDWGQAPLQQRRLLLSRPVLFWREQLLRMHQSYVRWTAMVLTVSL